MFNPYDVAAATGTHREHGQVTRGLRDLPRSPNFEGRFGRLFRRLTPLHLEPEVLDAIAGSMREGPAPGSGGVDEPNASDQDNPVIPAGYTYLGQFIDHDITFDPASSLQRMNDPDALISFRSPRFDLDSLYGSGRDDEPFQYDQEEGGVKFLIEQNGAGELDLPRNSQGVALIGDPRNDENVIVSQLQVLFLRFHNRVIDTLRTLHPELRGGELFAEAQRIVRWHYQWIVVQDFLPRMIGRELLDQILTWDQGLHGWQFNPRFYRARVNAFMPLEFSVAAFRFGHSQIRPSYNLNRLVKDVPIFVPAEHPGELDHLGGFRPLPRQWAIDWALFFGSGQDVQPSRRINTKLADALVQLPTSHGSDRRGLASRNLLRSQAFQLPSGEDVARAMQATEPLTAGDLGFDHGSPLWFYVLKEAEVRHNGERLGEVGGRIVGEVLAGLLMHDSLSFANVEPNWKPFVHVDPAWTSPLSDAVPERFTMEDLTRFAEAG